MEGRPPNSKILQKLRLLHNKLPQSSSLMEEPYQPPKKLKKAVNQEGYTQGLMQEISDHMGYYLKISARVQVHLVSEKELREIHGREAAGLYKTHGLTHREIWLTQNKQFQLRHMLAILAHEYTHNFLTYHGIREGVTYENELLTDTAALYIGFGTLIYRGYQPIRWQSDHEYYQGRIRYKKNEIRLGYIRPGNITYGIKQASQLRSNPLLLSSLPLWQKLFHLPSIWSYQKRLNRIEKLRKSQAEQKLKRLQKLFSDLDFCLAQSKRLPSLLHNPAPPTQDLNKQRLRVDLAHEVSIGSLPLELSSLEKKIAPLKAGRHLPEKELLPLIQQVEDCRTRIENWLGAFDALR